MRSTSSSYRSDEAEGDVSALIGLDILKRLVEFSALLHSRGVEVTTAESLDAARSLLTIDLLDRELFRDVLRTTLVKRPEDYATFEHAFELFWTAARRMDFPLERSSIKEEEEEEGPDYQSLRWVDVPQEGDESLVKEPRLAPGQGFGSRMDQDGSDVEMRHSLAYYSPAETLGRKAFRNPESRYAPPLKRNLKRFARRIATRPGRRFVRSEGGEVDFRRTFRAGLGTGGQFVGLERRRRKVSKSDILILCDISGSMDAYADELLRLLHLCRNGSLRADVFGFSTRLVRLNRYLQGMSLSSAARLISERVNFWSSGTRLGPAVGTLLSRHSSSLRPSTTVIIVSDGWELDDLGILEKNLRSIRRRAHGIIWLNPLADTPGYEPLTAGMKTALPYIDVLAGLKIFKDRREFERVLGKSISPRLRHRTRTSSPSEKRR